MLLQLLAMPSLLSNSRFYAANLFPVTYIYDHLLQYLYVITIAVRQYNVIKSFTRLLTYLLTYWLTHSLTHLLTHLLSYLFTYSYSLTFLLTYSLTFLLIYLLLLTYFLTYLLTYLLTSYSIKSFRWWAEFEATTHAKYLLWLPIYC